MIASNQNRFQSRKGIVLGWKKITDFCFCYFVRSLQIDSSTQSQQTPYIFNILKKKKRLICIRIYFKIFTQRLNWTERISFVWPQSHKFSSKLNSLLVACIAVDADSGRTTYQRKRPHRRKQKQWWVGCLQCGAHFIFALFTNFAE